MNEVIKADDKTLKFVQTKLAVLDEADKRKISCAEIEIVEDFLKGFVARVNVCMATAREILAPFLSDIVIKITEITLEYNTPDADIETAEKEIESLTNLLRDETANTESRMEIVKDDLANNILANGFECEKYLEDVYSYFEELLN